MEKFWYILGLVVFVGVSSCKKDKTPFPLYPPYNDLEHGWYTEDCSDSWPEHWVDSFNANSYYVDDHVVFKTPQFNPNNPDEIVYYHINYPENKRQLVKYNLKTMKKTILTNGIQVLNEPNWNSNGWIAFTHFPDFQIYLIKDDGSQLSQLTSINLSLDPQWSENGQFLYYATGQQLTQPFDFVRFNMNTHQIDTLNFLNGYEAISARQTKIKNDLVLSLGLFNNELYYVKAD